MTSTSVAAVLSALHVLAFGVGLGSAWMRWRALRTGDVARVLSADSAWGIAALLWLGSGLARAFGPFEKGADWYLSNPMFLLKMALFVLVVLLEIGPMVTFVRWRIARGRGLAPDLSNVPLLARINAIQVALVVVIPFVAASMARGVGWGH